MGEYLLWRCPKGPLVSVCSITRVKKKNVNKILILFLFFHLIIWTLIPSISNTNLPLDTIEALAWGNELQLGYDKHPPLSAWFLELFYQIFRNKDWAYYFDSWQSAMFY